MTVKPIPDGDHTVTPYPTAAANSDPAPGILYRYVTDTDAAYRRARMRQ